MQCDRWYHNWEKGRCTKCGAIQCAVVRFVPRFKAKKRCQNGADLEDKCMYHQGYGASSYHKSFASE